MLQKPLLYFQWNHQLRCTCDFVGTVAYMTTELLGRTLLKKRFKTQQACVTEVK